MYAFMYYLYIYNLQSYMLVCKLYSILIEKKQTDKKSNIKTAAARWYCEGKWICKLKTLAPHGLNTGTGEYAKEMYNF